MRECLKTYRIELTTKGPVFIGSGKEIGKKEYLFLGENKVGIIDVSQLYALLGKKHLDKKYEMYLLDRRNMELKQWLLDNRVSIKEVEPCMRYILKYGKLSMQRGKQLQILEFVKDSYGMPYVPGSSLKGMLRTILLSEDIITDQGKYRAQASKLKKDLVNYHGRRNMALSANIKQIEADRYNTLARNEKRQLDAVNDLMSGMIISDSDPLAVSDLVLCQRIERKPDGSESKLNVLRECIKPDTQISFNLTIDTSICTITVEQIEKAVAVFNQLYYDNFVRMFSGMDRPADDEVHLGGGVGFLSKTVIYPMFGKKDGISVTQKIFEKTNVPREHKHHEDGKLGVSPHVIKCAEYNGQTMQMGRCKMKIQ